MTYLPPVPIIPETNQTRPKVIVLVGIPGSGKSTWVKKWQEMHPSDDYQVVNQDIIGSRTKCIDKMHELLENNKNVIVDRCNVTEEQRSHWVQVALYHGVEVLTCIVLEVDEEEAIARVELRRDHPTISSDLSVEKKREIVYKFFNSAQTPKLSEGFSSIVITRN